MKKKIWWSLKYKLAVDFVNQFPLLTLSTELIPPSHNLGKLVVPGCFHHSPFFPLNSPFYPFILKHPNILIYIYHNNPSYPTLLLTLFCPQSSLSVPPHHLSTHTPLSDPPPQPRNSNSLHTHMADLLSLKNSWVTRAVLKKKSLSLYENQ